MTAIVALSLLYLVRPTLAARTAKKGRAPGPAEHLRYGGVVARPGRAVTASLELLRPYMEDMIVAMTSGMLQVRAGTRRIDHVELRALFGGAELAGGKIELAAAEPVTPEDAGKEDTGSSPSEGTETEPVIDTQSETADPLEGTAAVDAEAPVLPSEPTPEPEAAVEGDKPGVSEDLVEETPAEEAPAEVAKPAQQPASKPQYGKGKKGR